MSVEAISWALSMPVERSSAKFVLVAMANCAGQEMLCWPSVQYLCTATSQDRKTVLGNIQRLIEAGFIEDSGDRSGKTNQVVVYRLKTPAAEDREQYRKRNSTENGTVPFFPPNSTVFPMEQSRFSVETVPKTVHGTVKEPSIEKEQKTARVRAPKPVEVDLDEVIGAGIPETVAIEFIAHKRQVKAPLTVRAWADHCREAQKAGWTALQAAEKVMARNWKGFDAKYVANEPRGTPSKPPWTTHAEAKAAAWMGSSTLGQKAKAMRAAEAANVIDADDHDTTFALR